MLGCNNMVCQEVLVRSVSEVQVLGFVSAVC